MKTKKLTQQDLKDIVSLIDLTTLDPEDNEESVEKLCLKANTPLGTVAAICIFPKFVSLVAKLVNVKKIKIASVANFPSGNESLENTLTQIDLALSSGAQEIDVVLPYTCYKQGRVSQALEFITLCKKTCANALLKVILEISEFDQPELIYTLSNQLITSGADFIKTSTGKSKQGATLEGARAMLLAIKSSQKKNVGFKASGGIRTLEQAFSYIELESSIMGKDWVTSRHFRIGASSLIDDAAIYQATKLHRS